MILENLKGQILNGTHEVGHLIGTGRLGAVYVARSLQNGQSRAVKLFDPDLITNPKVLTRIAKDIAVLRGIENKNIVLSEEVRKHNGDLYYTFIPRLEGENLSTVLVSYDTLEIHWATRIVIKALETLSDAHKAGIVHGNLQPQNIYLVNASDKEGFVKILDLEYSSLGSPARVDRKKGNRKESENNPSNFLSPEQLRRRGEATPLSNVYSIGAILLRMVTGRVIGDWSKGSILFDEMHTTMPSDPLLINQNTSSELMSVIKKATAEKPADRYGDCLEFAKFLKKFPEDTNALLWKRDSEDQRKARNGESPEYGDDYLTAVREIGFASNFTRGDRAMHIQTEIICSGMTKIKTTVLDRGIVLDAKVQVLKATHRNTVEQIRETAEQQHENAVNALESGQYD